ncbi:MAG: PH domain-containing protein, partial [Gammaproteobacteria bacterium]
ERLAHAHMWPCVARGHFGRPRPALRAVPEVATVARVLAAALERSAGHPRAAAPSAGLDAGSLAA